MLPHELALYRRILEEYAKPSLSLSTLKTIGRYKEILLKWNHSINLTSITGTEEILRRHFGESFFAASLVGEIAGRMLDIGSGAGFPGVIFGLQNPRSATTLLERNAKKVTFLKELVRELGLKQINVEQVNFSEWADLRDKGEFDLVSFRAINPETLPFEGIARMIDSKRGLLVASLGANGVRFLREHKSEFFTWIRQERIPATRERFVLIGRKKG